MMDNRYIIFDKNSGEIIGIYNDKSVALSVLQNADHSDYCKSSKSAIDEILNIHVTIDVSVASGEYIDADRFIHVAEDTHDLEKLNNYKSVLLSDISNMSNRYSSRGMDILIDGNYVRFEFSYGEQQRMKELIDNYGDRSTVYYAPNGGHETEFAYSDIKRAYAELFNNKNLVYIYTDILNKWIEDNLTLEAYESKEEMYTFGYVNDVILKEVNERYEKVKLC